MNKDFKDIIKELRRLDNELRTNHGLRLRLSKEFADSTENGREHRVITFGAHNIDLRDGSISYATSNRVVYENSEECGLFIERVDTSSEVIKNKIRIQQLGIDNI